MNILERIVSDTRELIEQRKKRVPLTALMDQPYYNGPTLPMVAGLRSRGLGFIAEIKQASPSKGIIRADFDVKELAIQYKWGGASAISVLTEPNYFKGSLNHLAQARSCVDLPLLRKDFIVDAYQLHEARAYGADAVLLIATVLDERQLDDLFLQAKELGLSCLIEVYEKDELDKIDMDKARMIGANNRDLRTFQVDIDRSLHVLRNVPESIVRVSESGLRTPEDLVYLKQNGIDAVLIGESFMRARHAGQALHAMKTNVETLLETPPKIFHLAS